MRLCLECVKMCKKMECVFLINTLANLKSQEAVWGETKKPNVILKR